MLCERGRSSHIPPSDYSAAFERVRQAECAVAASAGDQYAVPLDLGFKPSSAVTAPLLILTPHSVILAFSAWKKASEGSPHSGTAIVEFDGCCWSTFGYPNDEALEGHPLWGRGLAHYGIFDVHNSPWVRRMTEQNRVAFPNTKDDSETRHLIFSFHDNTFECLCRGIKAASISSEPLGELTSSFAKICKGILEEGV